MPSSSYRPREEGVAAARGLAARQLVRPSPGDPGDGVDAVDVEGAGGDGPAAGLLPLAVADRLPPRLRAVRWQASGRAVVGVVFVLGAVLAVAGLVLWRSWPSGAAPAGDPVPARVEVTPTSTATPTSGVQPVEPSPAGEVVVHVAGRVLAPGLVTLSAGSRVADALTAAGGPAADADLDGVNLARPLVDGEQVLVPGPGDPPAAAGPVGTGAGGAATTTLVNLNTGTVADFDTLPGVGEVLAARIVAWREENGRFESVEDLGEVVGIGPKVLDGVRDLVTV